MIMRIQNMQPKKHAPNIVWNNKKTPVSIHFDDVYFNDDNAIAESNYVFINGNQLLQQFIQHNETTFIIGETGFGSGLNFLIVWHHFLQFRHCYPDHILKKLSFFSVEKFPLSLEEMQTIHLNILQDNELIKLANQLQQFWPAYHHTFEQVTLDILFDDINLFAPYLREKNILINAWFFDGFSPAKNPTMWSEKVFKDLYQITKPKGTFATFTAASQVRKNLINANFNVKKHKGYGKKREMLIGYKL